MLSALMLLILLVLATAWVGYPLWLRRQARYVDHYPPASHLLSADILIAAHNEERCIRAMQTDLRLFPMVLGSALSEVHLRRRRWKIKAVTLNSKLDKVIILRQYVHQAPCLALQIHYIV